ncbi:hypothetical protein BGX31_006544 [Mortierella sp. GBA43]|nr:hypothetical protein BGX31_006544 [Mortierella sp. GBA43]
MDLTLDLGVSNIRPTCHMSPDSPASPLSPSTPSDFSDVSSRSSSSIATPCNEKDDHPIPSFSILLHPAVVFASDRLSDPTYTSRLRTVNIFDFDQTLFQSPLPNPALWDPSFLGTLTSWNYCGTGWWHNPGTLELGPDVEASCWDGWWNEDVVQKVQESSGDPGCLTVLLTGRNGPTFGHKLIEMAKRKGLDFDLIATKPTTVARIEEDDQQQQQQQQKRLKTTKKAGEKYLKVHTFCTKHEFLYSVLLEYPHIRSMHLWDDRPCQVAQFRQVGQDWLNNKMLDHFEVTVVKEALIYMDPQRETQLVLAMVEANNRQVDIEQAGGPFLVAGVGALPRTRPELKDMNIWDPYETYVPQARFRIEVDQVVQYTGVVFSPAVQKFIKDRIGSVNKNGTLWVDRPRSLQAEPLDHWNVPDGLHVTLHPRATPVEFLETIGGLGATVMVEIQAVGQHLERAWALKVKEVNPEQHVEDDDQRPLHIVAPSGNIYNSLDDLKAAYTILDGPTDSTLSSSLDHLDLEHLGYVILSKPELEPHITMAYDRTKGSRLTDTNLIRDWEPLTTPEGTPFAGRVILVGTIGQKQLLGMKPNPLSGQKIVKAEVSLGSIVKNLLGDKDIPGKELGILVKAVKEEMERLLVENRASNEELIATIAQDVCDRAECMKMSSAAASPTLAPGSAIVSL